MSFLCVAKVPRPIGVARRSFLVALLSPAAFSPRLTLRWKRGCGAVDGAGKDRRQRWGKTEEIRPVITWSTRSRRTVAFGPLFRLSTASVHLIFVPLPCVFLSPSFLRSPVVIFHPTVATATSAVPSFHFPPFFSPFPDYVTNLVRHWFPRGTDCAESAL